MQTATLLLTPGVVGPRRNEVGHRVFRTVQSILVSILRVDDLLERIGAEMAMEAAENRSVRIAKNRVVVAGPPEQESGGERQTQDESEDEYEDESGSDTETERGRDIGGKTKAYADVGLDENKDEEWKEERC
jgi:hypothetical protein